MAYLLVYMGGALFCLYRWQKKAKSNSAKRLAKGFVVLDTLVVALGFLTIFVIPYFTPLLPPAGCVSTLIFGVWYWGWLRDYDFLHVELALNPGYILESCIDAMVVADEDSRLLYANTQAHKLLGEDCLEGGDFLGFVSRESRLQMEEILATGSSKESPLELVLKNGTPVLCSISRIRSKKRCLNVRIVCMNDVSQLKKAQQRFAYLAHYGDLTRLYNRRCLNMKLEEWKAWAQSGNRESERDFELLFLDITGFKQINVTFGHKA